MEKKRFPHISTVITISAFTIRPEICRWLLIRRRRHLFHHRTYPREKNSKGLHRAFLFAYFASAKAPTHGTHTLHFLFFFLASCAAVIADVAAVFFLVVAESGFYSCQPKLCLRIVNQPPPMHWIRTLLLLLCVVAMLLGHTVHALNIFLERRTSTPLFFSYFSLPFSASFHDVFFRRLFAYRSRYHVASKFRSRFPLTTIRTIIQTLNQFTRLRHI
mmetsp:Transcript_71806/g.144531  ORF Transcript_71806/g.144531 Transcript_71806/m.144531 type:complete len:217 (+) Transcript_71806:769-1419(+)